MDLRGVCCYVDNAKCILKINFKGVEEGSMPLILRDTEGQIDLHEFKISLVYISSSRPTRATQRDLDLTPMTHMYLYM